MPFPPPSLFDGEVLMLGLKFPRDWMGVMFSGLESWLGASPRVRGAGVGGGGELRIQAPVA